MKETQVVIIGGGPAGLAAGIEIAKSGGQVTVLDENKTSTIPPEQPKKKLKKMIVDSSDEEE